MTTILVTAVPTPAGVVSSKFRDGNDAGSQPPTTPQLNQPVALNDDVVEIPLATPSTGGTAPLHYELERSATSAIAGFAVIDANAVFTGGIYSNSGLAPSTQYWWRLAAVDSAAPARRSGYSAVVTATTPAAPGDTTRPSNVTGLITSSPTPGVVNLSFNAASDNVGVTGYDILRGLGDGAGNAVDQGAIIDTVTNLTYQNTGLTQGQEYYFQVKARDAAGNVSLNWTAPSFVTVATAGGGGVALVLNEGMENGFPNSVYGVALTDGAGTLEQSTTHAREGLRSLHTRIVKAGTANFRQEYRIKTPVDNQPSAGSQHYWCGFAMYIPASTFIGTQRVSIQWHTVTSNSGASPVIAIRHINNRWQFTSDSMADELIGPTIVRDQWHDWVFDILWRNNATGSCKIWHNGILLVDRTNVRTTWGGENNMPWLHIGDYSSAWKLAGNADANGSVHEMYQDSLRIAVSNAAVYADVAPVGNRLTAP